MVGSMKEQLQQNLAGIRSVVVVKLDGLSEYDVRRPMSPTGTNLLGLVNHLTAWEAVYLGQLFDRPFPEPRTTHDDFWIPPERSRSDVIERFWRVAAHADETIRCLDLDTPTQVEWWSPSDVTLFNVIVHVITETYRHAGHMDILREQLDGITSERTPRDAEALAARFDQIERAAKAAAQD